ncbi:MAG: prepilin-type N-terminal cleavage/methylation domain-containing protein [Planctomycetota bacterium]
MAHSTYRDKRDRTGFSLIELSVVVILVGVLVAISVPHLLENSERKKASESFKYLENVQTAQERYHAVHSQYASGVKSLDLERIAPTYFTVGPIVAEPGKTLEETWSLTLTRAGNSNRYGAYTVTFTQKGFDTQKSTVTPRVQP